MLFPVLIDTAASKIKFLDPFMNSIVRWLANFSNVWCVVDFRFKTCIILSSIVLGLKFISAKEKKLLHISFCQDLVFITTYECVAMEL